MAFYGLLFLALSSTLLLQFSLTTAQSFVDKFCLGANYTANSTYEANLNLLLSSISNNNSKFYTNTVGRTPDRVYGLFQCRVDFSSEDCNKCAVTATQEITIGCPYKKESVVFYDPCWLRYSDTPFFTVAELDEDRTAYVSNPNNASDPDKFNTDLTELMERLVSQAVSGTQLFSIGKEIFTSSQNIYGLVQCTQDLSASNCSRCLGSAVSDLSGCCSSTEGGRVFKPSCIARFETFEFYQNGALLVPPTAPAPPPLITPGPNTNTTTGQEKKSSINIVAIVVPAVIAAVLLSIVIIFFCLRRKKGFVIVEDVDQISNVESLQLKLTTVAAATENFSEANKLGEGGFGPVYKGKLSDGQEIAVKRLSRNSGQGVAEFKNEILLLAKLQHRNLVRLLGFCLEGEEKLLIYEFVTNASLDQFIFDPIKRTQLDWGKRYNIIGGIARGLLYLHEDSQIRIIHRDLKASNILLNDQMNPKISDFGTARLFMMDQTHANTRRIAGTFGYMPPEYVIHGHFSVKSDVFSFGVLVLELISGKKNTSLFETECADDLLCYAWRSWREGTALELLDPVLRDYYNENEVTRCIHIGLLCVQEDVAKRPTMATVVLMLSSYSVNLALPSPPPRYGSFTISGSMPHSNNEVSVTELSAR